MIFLILLFGFFLPVTVIFFALYWSFQKNKNYWSIKNVIYKEPRFLAGNFAEAGTKNLGIIFRELYEEAKNEKFFEIWQFNVPVLLVIDLELVKKILVADFPYFDDHGVYFDEKTITLSEEKGEKFSYEQAAAQAFIFFTAGFETSSTTMQYALFELAMNPDIQDRVRTEMQQVSLKRGGSLTYDTVQEMTYLGRVLDETLRKYPRVTNLSRMCTKEYKISGTNVVLNKGTRVSVSVLDLHWDDRYYPNPEKFDPDRFTEDQKSSRPPYTYMPFGEGPRTCIGQRFGLIQIKIGLIIILLNYKVSITKSETRVPPVYDPKSFFSAPKGGMKLKISLL